MSPPPDDPPSSDASDEAPGDDEPGIGDAGNDGPVPPDADALVEAAAGAHRQHLPGPLRFHPAWHDLDAAGRVRAFERALALRDLEAALDPEGLSTTVRAVLARLPRG